MRGVTLADHVGPVVLASDDEAFRSMLATGFRRAGYIVEEVVTGKAAVQHAEHHSAAVVVVDFRLADMWGYEVCERLRRRDPSPPAVLLIDAELGASARVAGFLVGADECIDKPLDLSELLARVGRLRPAPPPGMPHAGHSDLTGRELDVLRRLASGRTPEHIATELFISRRTVDTHIQRILRKLGVNSRAQAIALAFQANLVRPGELPTNGPAAAQ